ncbi:MAG TPA: hypothetical protein VGO68_09630 [Pyrinomonadaceae bacterium]|jgi:hypothetical protein|nr:hypothetical protein [Pyrinomonadaceae bacterium]
MIKKTHRRLLLLLSLLLITVILNTGSVPQAECANATCGTSLPIYTYYTDASKTVECGYFNVCWGDQQGCVTEFKTSRRELCWNCN